MKKPTLTLVASLLLSVSANAQNYQTSVGLMTLVGEAVTETRVTRPATKSGLRMSIIEPQSRRRHRFGVGLPFYFNAKAKFSASRTANPGAAPAAVPTLADGRVSREYDDGFNRVNSAGNPALGPGGTPVTTHFGYQSDGQVANAAGAGTISMHSVALNGGDYQNGLNNDVSPGVEFTYQEEWADHGRWTTYWEVGAGYQNFNWKEEGTSAATASVITDTFALNGVILPGGTAPYTGPFTPVPGAPAIGSTPTRGVADMVAAVTGTRKIVLHAFQFRAGPGIDWRSEDNRWRVGAQAGLNVGFGFSEMSYNEQIAIAGLPLISQSGGSTSSHAWAGLFTALRLHYQINPEWGAQAELRHQLTGNLHHNGQGRSVDISLSDGFGVTGGLTRSF
ncbi:MAG: hypothetical protein ACJASX_000930 [Limisphaerales bacterium]|jgi:hypothetical protein